MTTGHKARDHRIYDKEARSVAGMGAEVVITGPHPDAETDENSIRIIKSPDPKNLFRRFLFQPWITELLSLSVKPDIVHLHDLELLQIVPLLRVMMPKAKIVYDVHEDFSGIIAIRGYIPRVMKPSVRLAVNVFEKSFVRMVNGVVAVTDPLAARFHHSRKIAVYNFPSAQFYRHAGEKSMPAGRRKWDLVHLGTLSKPRARFLAEIIALLNEKKPGIMICVAGLHPEIHDFLASLVPRCCTLLGKIPYEDVPSLLGSARIGLDIHPFETVNLKVAVPVKIFEYMACGAAVITSTMPVLDELISRAGAGAASITCIKAGTPDTFADAIVATLRRMEEGDDPGSRLQAMAQKHYVWEKEASKLARFYLDLLDRPSSLKRMEARRDYDPELKHLSASRC